MKKNTLIVLACLLCSVSAWATHTCTTCYISSAGSDSNSGATKLLAWLHPPGSNQATGNAASQVVAAGDSYIFRGGDTWHYGNSGATPYIGTWAWSGNGTNGNPVYIGVDITWFSGGSWVRPIISGDNPLNSAFVASCTYNQSTTFGLNLSSASYVNLDNLEWSGRCWSSAGANSASAYIYHACNLNISNNYIHGWTATFSSADNQVGFLGNVTGSCGLATNNVFYLNVFDGSDSSHVSGACGQGYEPSMPCYSGIAIYADGYDIHQNVFRYMSDFVVAPNLYTYHDNLAEFLYTTYQPSGPHSNVINNNESGANTNIYFYNNIWRHTYVTQNIFMYLGSGGTAYIFNNVAYDNLRYDTTGDTAPTNCIIMQGAGGTQTVNVYDNTFDNDTDQASGGGCQISFFGTPGNPQAWSGPANFENNHFLGYANLASFCCAVHGSGVTGTGPNDNGGELFQATATARSQGYTQANADAPQSPSGSTVGAGNNIHSSCSTFSSDSALCSGTSLGVSEQSGSGGLVASYPSITINPRQATAGSCTAGTSGCWDSGAYLFSTGTIATPSFMPIAGTYTGLQSVTISSTAGATICYTTDNSTPTANGAGTCTHGTTYTTPVSVATNETLKAVGSKNGSTDSSVGSAAYTINYLLTVTLSGSGTVTSADTDINCPTTCSFAYGSGATSVLTATPTGGFTFTGWSGGGCSGTGTCTVTMSSAQAVTATFVGSTPVAAPAIIMSGIVNLTGGISR